MNPIKLLSETFFPKDFTCDICGAESFGSNFCKKCLPTVTFNGATVCPVCGRKTALPEICIECKANTPVYKKAISPLVYDGGVIPLISKFKNGYGYLKDYFAKLIVNKLPQVPACDCIVCVPMTKKALKKRTYNQSELLAREISRLSGIPFIKGALIKIKETDEQKSLAKRERAENLKTCFKVEKREEIKGKKVLLTDDVLTTGATADAVAAKLLSAGAASVFLATAASVQYKPKQKPKELN